MSKWQEDLDDVKAIYDDVLRFLPMKFEDYKKHIDEHPEDKLHHINLREGGSLHISAASSKRFAALTKREIEVNPSGGDLDRKALDRAIRDLFVEVFLERGQAVTRPVVDKMLARAVKRSKAKHRPITHYLPCVVVGDREPREFRVGPVRFIHRDKFFADFGDAMERDHQRAAETSRAKAVELFKAGKLAELKPQEEIDDLERKMLEWAFDYYKQYKWIAEVTVPPCDSRISRIRAELTVQGALDVLKLFAFGWYYGRRVHLAMDHGIIDKVAEIRRKEDGEFTFTWSRGADWALVEDGWFEEVEKRNPGYFSAAGDVIETYLSPHDPTEIATRWLDALNWYGQAVSERVPSVQIVKYVATLERLTITEKTPPDEDRGLTDAVTRRAALFASFGDEDALQKAREGARELYRWRSDLMHGRNSPVPKQQSAADEVRALVPRADELVRSALIGALGEYAHLVKDGTPTTKALEERLRVLESAFNLVPREAPPTASSDDEKK
jgi:hypothetical protein